MLEKENNMAPNKKFPCIVCDENVGNNTDAIQCSSCELWNHKKCGISEDVWKLIRAIQESQGDSAATWFCKSCQVVSTKLNKEMKEMRKEMNDMKEVMRKEMKDMKEVNQNLTKQVAELQDTVKCLKKDVNTNKDVAVNAESLNIKTIMRELDEQESRRCNLICHNVPESPSHNAEDRKEFDFLFTKDLLLHMNLNIVGKNITAIKRLGKRSNKPRPMMIICADPALRDEVLARKNRLSRTEGDWKLIKISPDLTQQQRQNDKEIYEEVEKKNHERSENDCLNFQFRAVGQKGRKKLIKTSIEPAAREHPTLGAHVEAALQEREENMEEQPYSTQMLEEL